MNLKQKSILARAFLENPLFVLFPGFGGPWKAFFLPSTNLYRQCDTYRTKDVLSHLGPAIKFESNETRVCVDRNSYNRKLVEKVVGTFKNGTLNGPCRVFFTDEISMIGIFVNGDPKGLLRAFDAKGQLLDIFYEDVRKNGHMWMNKNNNLKYLIYTDGSFVKKNSKGGVISQGVFKLAPS